MDKEKLWTSEIYNLYQNKNLEEIQNKLFELSDILIYINEINAEKKAQLNENEIYSEQLIIKFYLQNFTLINTSKGVNLKSTFFSSNFNKLKFVDISSIFTIVRSQYETLLMYQHLYINSKDLNQNNLRFQSWILSSMLQRSKVFNDPKTIDQQILKEKDDNIEYLKNQILNNPSYNTLTEKQRKQILETGSGKLFKTWDTIFDESKFKKDGTFSKLYFMASVYAHSEGLLALQLKSTRHLFDDNFIKESNYLMLFYSYLMTNIMIKNVINVFPLSFERYNTLDEKIKFQIDINYNIAFK